MLDLTVELRTIVALFDQAQIPYALCGGMAMAVYGVPRATLDIDIVVRPEDAGRIRQMVAGAGYTLPSAPLVFADGAVEIVRLTRVEQASGDHLSLDLLLVSPSLDDVWAGRKSIAWEGGRLSVVSVEGLARLKRLRGTARDLEEIELLAGDDGDQG